MILVNSQGTRQVYPMFEHAIWDGCTFADLVFPFFLFIVGMSIGVKYHSYSLRVPNVSLYKEIFKRTALLFILGLFLNIFPLKIDWARVRIYGILQRIALCYGCCSLLYLKTTTKIQGVIFVLLLLGYWLLMTKIPIPGVGKSLLTPTFNWGSYVDQLLFSPGHLFGHTYDPEGLLGTLPALATTISGLLAGELLFSKNKSSTRKYVLMCIWGLVFIVLGWYWSYSFPLNKNLWTSSFVLWTSGWALLTFSSCYAFADLMGYASFFLPLRIMGMNALFIFVFHVILLKVQAVFSITSEQGLTDNLRVVITEYCFGRFGEENAALLYALSFLFLNFLVAAFLYHKKWFIKL